jgi:hypothetical protein
MYNMVWYLCVLIVFSLHRETLKLILATDPLLRWPKAIGKTAMVRVVEIEQNKFKTVISFKGREEADDRVWDGPYEG